MKLIAITTRDSLGELRTFYVESEAFAANMLNFAQLGFSYSCCPLPQCLPFVMLHRREVEVDLQEKR